jgi:hypothetical protein
MFRGISRPGVPRPGAIVGILILLAALQVVSTYPILNSTSDEPAHISAGMEWLQWRTYSYELQHPPLARIAVALGPYLKGLRSEERLDSVRGTTMVIFNDGNRILYSDGRYWTNLTLARLGTIPFLVLTMLVTYWWGKQYFSIATGLWAVAFVACCPPILGQAGLATLDMACAATVVLALWQFTRWFERRASWTNSALLGLSLAAAFWCKFSALPYLITCCLTGMFLVHLRSRKTHRLWTRQNLNRAAFGIVAIVVCFFLMWVGYRFTLAPLAATYGAHPTIDAVLNNHAVLQRVWKLVLGTPLPLTEWMLGIRDLWRHDMLGHDSYLLGQYRNTGWWYFFPVVIAVKTPIGLLVLAIAGTLLITRRHRTGTWQQEFTVLFPVMLLAVAMTSRIDAGVRHILPIYPFAAILAGQAMVEAIRRRGPTSLVAILLAAAIFAESWQAHPDYLSHFNVLAGRRPERILAESDLDLGQDLQRLSLRMKELHADHLSIGYFGSAPLDRAGLPPYRVLGREQVEPGYVAVSLRYLYLDNAKNGSYEWIKRYTPVERIGTSIDLYYLEHWP